MYQTEWTKDDLQRKLRVDADQAEKIEGIVNGSIDPETFPSVQDWISQCYNRPRKVELKLCALNEILGTHGVEAIQPESAWVDSYWRESILHYCNTGDSYRATIGYDTEREEFVITSWGDFLENWERENPEEEEEEEDDTES